MIILITLYALLSRFLFLTKIPPVLLASSVPDRILSALISVVTVILVYLYSGKISGRKKIALLSAWTVSVMPWTVEQGRIASPPGTALLFFVIILILCRFINRKILKFFLILAILPVLYLVYPGFWIFRSGLSGLNLSNFINNLFILISPGFLFQHNITFWWGGIREFGVLYVSMLPFFLLGLYELIKKRRFDLIISLIILLVISAASPYFPESREFYLSVPYLALAVSFGIYRFDRESDPKSKLLLALLFIWITYDISQFWHFYTVHYPIQVISNSTQIHGAF